MSELFKTVVMWEDGSISVEYDGKWFSQAHDAGEKAMENKAFYVEIETIKAGETVNRVEVKHPAWS